MPYADPTSNRAIVNALARSRRYEVKHRVRRAATKRGRRAVTAEERRADLNSEQKRTYYEARAKLYSILGSACVGCGHQDIRALEFDHINGDGAEDRRRFIGARSMLDYYGKRPEEACGKLQVLCRNCNWLKRKGYDLGVPTPKSGGRMLDGRTWDEMPEVKS